MSQQKQPQVIDLIIKYASDINSALTNAIEMRVAGQHPDVFGHVISSVSLLSLDLVSKSLTAHQANAETVSQVSKEMTIEQAVSQADLIYVNDVEAEVDINRSTGICVFNLATEGSVNIRKDYPITLVDGKATVVLQDGEAATVLFKVIKPL
jgi:hypothetical protein